MLTNNVKQCIGLYLNYLYLKLADEYLKTLWSLRRIVLTAYLTLNLPK